MVMVRDGAATVLDELAGLDLFEGTDRTLLGDVAARGLELRVPSGHTLMRSGSEARELVVILDGHAEVSIARNPVAYLGPGSCCGEMSLLDGRRRTADVRAAAPMRLFVLSREDFFLLLERSPAFGARMLTTVVGRLRLANAALAERADRV
jgi:CRP/FNR family transcriptional regulator, cyclic AMP receptor protein